jgi:DUF1365 family protein
LEVNNTFGGKHYYALSSNDCNVKKSFQVSPFNKIEGEYHIVLKNDFCKIDLVKDKELVFTASIEGKENANLENLVIAKFPLYGFKILYEIHRQALLLFLKRNKFYGSMGKEKGNIC